MTETRAAREVSTRLMYMNVYDVNGTIKVGWGLHGDRYTAELVMLQHLDTLRSAGFKNLSGAIVPVYMQAAVSPEEPVQAFRLDGHGLVRAKFDVGMSETAPTAPEPAAPAPEPAEAAPAPDPTAPPFETAPPSPETAAAIAAHTARHHVPSFD